MNPRLLIFGGTTQGKQLSCFLSDKGVKHFYSSKTAIKPFLSTHATYINGSMDSGQIAAFCTANEIIAVLDASHPFAEGLHAEIAVASNWCKVPVFRYERPLPPRVTHPLVMYCASYEIVQASIFNIGFRRIFATTGVNTIPKLKALWNAKGMQCWFRILDRESSIEKAKSFGIPDEYVFPSPPPESAAQELVVLKQLLPDAVISKNSGTTGGIEFKISACLALGIPIYIVERPKSQSTKQCFSDLDQMFAALLVQ